VAPLGLNLGKNKGGRPKGSKTRPADERLKEAQARDLDSQRRQREKYLRWLEEHDPAHYRQVMEASMGIAREPEKDALKQLAEQIKTLRAAGLIEDPRKIGDDGDALKTILAAVGAAAAGFMQQQGGQAPALPPPPPPAAGQPAAPGPVGAAPGRPRQAPPAPTGPPPEPPADPTDQDAQEANVNPLMLYAFAGVAQHKLTGATPEQAAALLLEQTHPLAQELVAELRGVDAADPAGIERVLRKIELKYEPLRGFVDWLRQRPGWLAAVVAEVQRRDPAAHVGI